MVGENYRIRDVAEIVEEVVPGLRGGVRRRCLAGHAATTASTSARSPSALPGFTPRGRSATGVEELYQAYTGGGLTEDDWNGWRYYRLRTVKHLQDEGVIDAELRRVG